MIPAAYVLHLPFICGKTLAQTKLNQRNENMQKQRKTAPGRPNNNNVVIKYSQGPLVPSQGP